MKKLNINKIGVWTAILSFIIGTLFFSAFLYFKNINIAISAYFFIVIAGIVNASLLIALLISIIQDSSRRKKYYRTTANLLANIPIVIVYFCIAYPMINNIRNTIELTLVNNTDKPILEISVEDCDSKFIEKLDIKESKTLYINITHDCILSMSFNKDGDKQTESIYGYVTTGTGGKKTYYFNK